MLTAVSYILNFLLLLSMPMAYRMAHGERRFSFSLIQVLLGLPLLAAEYVVLASRLQGEAVHVLLFSEYVFALLWFFMAWRLRLASLAASGRSGVQPFLEILGTALFTGMAVYFLILGPVAETTDTVLVLPIYGPGYFLAIFSLLAGLYAALRLEAFWRGLDAARRWEYKSLVIGALLACGAMLWAASYRLVFLRIIPAHLHLLAVLLLLAWAMMAYGVARHRLLNRKVFISRKVIYSFVAPALFGAYLLGFAFVSLAIHFFGFSLPFVLNWLLVVIGLVCAGLYACSSGLRRRVHFFISTHFYVNKYEYRDEWLALSRLLQGAMSEAEVVRALEQVLAESLYTSAVFIWLGDSSRGYRLLSLPENADPPTKRDNIGPENPLIGFFSDHSHFHLGEKGPDRAWKTVAEKDTGLFSGRNLVLLSPISSGNQLVGIIGLGQEFTGGRYDQDDFDLLTALGNHTGAALLAARMAEELARTREQQAWERLSAFVLHDIKNAASMLSLLRQNAPEHIHEPEFQKDMLETVDDALRRMGRVEQRLRALKDELLPEKQEFQLGQLMEDCRRQLAKRLPALRIVLDCRDDVQLKSDPKLLASILENLLLNALEAGGEGTCVRLGVRRDDQSRQAVIEVSDDGPGIPPDLLPEGLFEPFKTSKEGGSGIGLWQAKRLVTAIGGSISAENLPQGGAQFVVRLPFMPADPRQ